MPVPPVISTVPAAHASGMVSTTLPMWRAWLRCRSAAGARRTSHVDHRQRPKHAASLSRPPRPSRICADAVGPGLEEVEGAVADAGMGRGDGVRRRGCRSCPSPGTTPPRGSSRSDASTKSPDSESSTTSTPRPPVTARNFCSKSRRAGVADVVVVEAHGPQRVPLAAAGGGEHLQAPVPGQLHRGHPDTTGARHGPAPTDPAARRPAPPARSTPSRRPTVKPAAAVYDQSGRDSGSRRARRWWRRCRCPRGTGPSPRSPTANSVTPAPISMTMPAASMPMHAAARVHAQRDHHVAEVGARLPSRATRICPASSGASASGIGLQHQVVERAARSRRSPSRHGARRPAGAAATSAARLAAPARCRHAVADDDLRLAEARPTAAASTVVASVSTRTTRPGCSVCAARTRPHTAAPARSVTSSPGRATAPRVVTTRSGASRDDRLQPRLQPLMAHTWIASSDTGRRSSDTAADRGA